MSTFKMSIWADENIDNMDTYVIIKALEEITSASTPIGEIHRNTVVGDNSFFAWASSNREIGEALVDLIEVQMRNSVRTTINTPPKGRPNKKPRQGLNDPAFKAGIEWAVSVLQFEKIKSKTRNDQIYLTSTISMEDLQARLNIINTAQ